VAEAAQAADVFYVQFIRQHVVGGNPLELEVIPWAESLLRRFQQLAFAAQICAQAGIEHQAPEDIPVAWLPVHCVLVDDQAMVVAWMRARPILFSGQHHVQIEPSFPELFIAKALAQIPTTQLGHAQSAGRLRRKQHPGAIVVHHQRPDWLAGKAAHRQRGDDEAQLQNHTHVA